MRREICSGLEFMGVELDEERNQIRKKEAIISKEGAKVAVVVVPTNEEIIVARETARIIKWNPKMKKSSADCLQRTTYVH